MEAETRSRRLGELESSEEEEEESLEEEDEDCCSIRFRASASRLSSWLRSLASSSDTRCWMCRSRVLARVELVSEEEERESISSGEKLIGWEEVKTCLVVSDSEDWLAPISKEVAVLGRR